MKDFKSKPKGLAALSAKRRREIAALGGKSVPSGRRNYSDPEQARKAGLAGAESRRQKASKMLTDA